MGNHVKARPRAKPKPKSVKAKITRKMGSKRRTQKMGKELKKGQKGAAASYFTRAKVLRRLQISLRDFRRLCILKGVYPRDPSKKVSGKDKTYYHIKDVGFLEHEPVLQSFRDFKAFMRKLRRSIGRGRLKDAQRRELNERPVYKLDHLVKERYPRFLDAVRDLDDALSLVHLFASLPQMKQRTSAHTETCKRLVKEWAFYVSKARCLTKVFVSIKGVYFQAEVLGQPVTWITPHVFTLHYPRDVDFSIMFTFLEFYETLLKFAMYKLFHTLELRYPPVLDAELDGLDAGLATLKTQTMGGVTEEGEMSDGVEEEEEQHRVLPTTKEERRAAKKKLKEEEKKIKSLEGKLGQIARADKAVTAAAADSAMANGARDKAFLPEEAGVRNGERDEEDEDVEMGEALTGPLEEAFMNKGGEGDEEDAFGTTMHGQGDVEDERRKRLFKGLRFFFGREVPKSWLEFVVLSCGGTVGWEGEGSPFTLEDPGITHQVMDRPTMAGPRRKRREYVQPQWLLDSLNARMLLPVARYAPGAVLPPHLSPFVDDAAEGYVPAYREELDRLRSAAEARRKEDLIPGEGRQDEEEGVVERSVGDDVAEGGDGGQDGVGEGVGEDGGGGDVEAAFARDLERERAGTSFSEASKKNQRRPQEEDDAEGEEDDDDEGEEDDDEGEEDDDKGEEDDDEGEEEGEDEGGDEEAIGEVAPLKAKEKGAQTEDEEHHELSKTMMSKKSKRLYGRMQHGLSKRREEIEKLKAKRKKLEAKYDATPNMAKANSSSAKKRRKLAKKNRSSSGVVEDAGKD